MVLFMLFFFGQEIEHHCHTSCGSLIVIGITFFIIKDYRWTEGVCLKRYFNKIWMGQIICYFYYHLQDAILYLTMKNLIENTNWKKQKRKRSFFKNRCSQNLWKTVSFFILNSIAILEIAMRHYQTKAFRHVWEVLDTCILL